jgi:hypothetical protein
LDIFILAYIIFKEFNITHVYAREKVKRWVHDRASRFLESYFKESLGSRHSALTNLRRLSAQVILAII